MKSLQAQVTDQTHRDMRVAALELGLSLGEYITTTHEAYTGGVLPASPVKKVSVVLPEAEFLDGTPTSENISPAEETKADPGLLTFDTKKELEAEVLSSFTRESVTAKCGHSAIRAGKCAAKGCPNSIYAKGGK